MCAFFFAAIGGVIVVAIVKATASDFVTIQCSIRCSYNMDDVGQYHSKLAIPLK